MYQWQWKSLAYAYGYDGDGDKYYGIGNAYPELHKYYGIISGPGYTLPQSIAGIFMGALCDITNRKWMLSITFLIAGATALVCGSVDSFGIFVAMRIIHAIVNSSINPLTYTFLSEMVPQNKRNTINSLMGATSYIGIAVSSLAIITIK